MELSEEEQLYSNTLLFAASLSPYSANKINNIAQELDAGADIDAANRNYKKNTALHTATIRGEVDIVKLLLERQAKVNIINDDGKTPLDIAVDSDKDAKQEIIDILNSRGAVSKKANNHIPKKLQKKVKTKSNNKNNGLVYQKRDGTSGACGQLYESKLLCLLFHRAKYANGISEFYLGTNINGIGALDDICLKYKIPGKPPVMLFLQAKHREDPEKGKVSVNDILSADGDFSLVKYFDSYLRIIKAICPSRTDLVFKEDFEQVDCNFVIFTSAKDDFDNTRKKPVNLSRMCEKVNDLIFTQNIDGVFQFDYTETDVNYLVQIIIKEQIKQLGKNFMKAIMAGQIENRTSFEFMMNDELIKKYHVILATSVLEITEVTVLETKTILKGVFRQDFFDTHDELLCVLKETFYSEIVLTHNKINMKQMKVEEIENNLNQLIENPTAFTVSNVIGNVVIFDEKTYKLKLLENNILSNDKIQHYRSELQILQVTSAIVKEAIEIAGLRKMMGLRDIPLPDFFGNKDMTVKERRIAFLETEINSLMKKSVANNKIIELNNETDSRILLINGGIGGAVGNLLVYDEDSEKLKFSEINLPNYADKLRTKLRDNLTENDRLSYYRFKVNINDFPRCSLRGTDYDKRVARNFLDRLYFYSGQGKENEIENIIKSEIDKHYNADKTEDEYLFRIHTDAIFSRFHDEMQKWWMIQKEAFYLTNKCEIFEKAKKEVVQQPVLTILNLMYINRVKKMGVQFNENIVSKMKLQTFTKGMLNIISDANILSGIKVWQYFKSCKDYTFLDFDYVAGLPSDNYKMMMVELKIKNTDINTLIILYETFKDTEQSCHRVKDIIKNFKDKKIIIITDEHLSTELKVYFPEESILDIRDDSNNMSNITDKSQIHILKDTRIVYQGEEVPLGTVIDNDTIHFLNGNILNKLLNNEKVEVGMAIADMKYKEVKNQYVDRYLLHDDKTYQVNTLKDIDKNVAVVTASPGEGKSILLTHISIETKKIDPKLWIARINLKDHSNEFIDWNQKKTDINIIKTVKFICKASIKNIGNLELELETIDGKITLNNREQIDSTILLQLDLFIHFFNNANIIYLFYGFEEICTHYEKEIICLLENLENCNQRFWVTTCSYSQYEKCLERYFKNFYTLLPCTTGFKEKNMDRYLKTDRKLSKLHYDQLNNINEQWDDTTSCLFGPDRESLTLSQTFELMLKMAQMLLTTFLLSTQCTEDTRSDFIDDLIKKSSNEYMGDISNESFPVRTLTMYTRFLVSNLKQLCTVITDDNLDKKELAKKFKRIFDEQLGYFIKLKQLTLFDLFNVFVTLINHFKIREIGNTLLCNDVITELFTKSSEILSSENMSELLAICNAMFKITEKIVTEIPKQIYDKIPLFKELYELGNSGISLISGLTEVIKELTPEPSTSAELPVLKELHGLGNSVLSLGVGLADGVIKGVMPIPSTSEELPVLKELHGLGNSVLSLGVGLADGVIKGVMPIPSTSEELPVLKELHGLGNSVLSLGVGLADGVIKGVMPIPSTSEELPVLKELHGLGNSVLSLGVGLADGVIKGVMPIPSTSEELPVLKELHGLANSGLSLGFGLADGAIKGVFNLF